MFKEQYLPSMELDMSKELEKLFGGKFKEKFQKYAYQSIRYFIENDKHLVSKEVILDSVQRMFSGDEQKKYIQFFLNQPDKLVDVFWQDYLRAFEIYDKKREKEFIKDYQVDSIDINQNNPSKNKKNFFISGTEQSLPNGDKD